MCVRDVGVPSRVAGGRAGSDGGCDEIGPWSVASDVGVGRAVGHRPARRNSCLVSFDNSLLFEEDKVQVRSSIAGRRAACHSLWEKCLG